VTTEDPPTTPAKKTLVAVRTMERERLHAAVAAATAQANTLTTRLTVAQTELTAATGALAELDQGASRLRQALAAATTGPERHQIELELDDNAWRRIRALGRQVNAKDEVASVQAKIVRESTAAGTLAGELTRAEAALTQAQADAATATTSRAVLVTTVETAQESAKKLDHAGANTKLDTLLGLPEMRTELAERLAAVAAGDEALQKKVRDAEAAVRAAVVARSAIDGGLDQAAADHATALADIDHALTAPARVARVAAAVATVLALADLPDAEQKVIKKAAEAAKAAAGGAVGAAPAVADAGPTPLETWALTIPATVLIPAVELLVAEADLEDLADVQPSELVDTLATAEDGYAKALEAQLEVQLVQGDAASEAAEARDDVTAHEATAADRRALAVSGN
jgi:chromosome segregation ATPase